MGNQSTKSVELDQIPENVSSLFTCGISQINLLSCLWVSSKKKKTRPPDKSAQLKIIFLISQPKLMLWLLKRTVSWRQFF